MGKFMSLSATVFLGLAVLLFNNCSEGVPSSDFAGLAPASRSGSSSTSSSSSSGSSPSSETQISQAPKVLVANSLSGPWNENGNVCRGQAIFVKTTGVNLALPVKGCASPSNNNDCLNLVNHRSFTAAETATGDIITSVTAAESTSWPVGLYAFFISESVNVNTTVLRKVGHATFQDCAGGGGVGVTPDPGVTTCAWHEINITAVIGGGTRVYPTSACTQATAGQTGSGYYDMGGGNTLPKQFQCKCG